ncbi:hypothetical protein MF406_02445 [Georgenia sp. TF02-10]|uniref:hypothetical protein n=1 Tax=Georgenia sp. TF02-10 TaxID=2917725 RepID=UPI001FA7195F|nr:hypothetical protein [Georgenia sp. TF02-10]UNX55165.1 hypothetical protein MF406_02445 [Georgenia sp. TF02-10]
MSKSKNKRRRPSRPRTTSDAPPRPVQSPAELTVPTAGDPGPGDPVGNEGGQIQLLVGLIATGALDDHLGTLQAAISQRHRDCQRTASNQAAARLQIGDRVMLNHDVRPLYLHGATGTVTGWASHNVIVQLDNPTGRFTTGQLRCPPLALQRLPE